MSAIVQMALSNAVLVTAATPLVWLIGRLARRPVLAHSLWLIVLFKLITPPLWTWGVQLPKPRPVAETQAIAPPAPGTIAVPEIPAGEAPTGFATPPTEDVIITTPPTVSISAPAPAAPTPAAPLPRTEPINWRAIIIPGLGIIWALGAIACIGVAVFRLIRFTRALGWAAPASDAVQARADALARSVGLERAPIVQFVPGPLCPMLWPVGRSARLLLPEALWARLDSVQRDTVLLHELAHWARRDHWVRWAELLATSLYWWLPACWVARKELRRAEEQCCDAWVLWALPGAFQHYAHALLQTVDFVSVPADRSSALWAAPALASGMGQFSDLKGRLTMLKQGNVSRALSFGGMMLVFGLGALLLPISPTIGQDATPTVPAADQASAKPGVDVAPEVTPGPDTAGEPKDPQPKPTVSKEPTLDRSAYEKLHQMNLLPAQDATDAEYIRRLYLDLIGTPPSEELIRQFAEDPAPSAEKRKVLLDKLLASTPAGAHERALRDSQKRIDELVRQLDQANARIAALKAQADILAKERQAGFFFRDGASSNVPPPWTRPELKTAPPSADQAQPLGLPGTQRRDNGQAAPSVPPGPNGVGSDYPAAAGATPPPDQNGPGDSRRGFNRKGFGGYGGGGADSAQRLDRLEAELKVMLKEIDSLRAERQRARTAAPSPEDPTSVQPQEQSPKQ